MRLLGSWVQNTPPSLFLGDFSWSYCTRVVAFRFYMSLVLTRLRNHDIFEGFPQQTSALPRFRCFPAGETTFNLLCCQQKFAACRPRFAWWVVIDGALPPHLTASVSSSHHLQKYHARSPCCGLFSAPKHQGMFGDHHLLFFLLFTFPAPRGLP